MHTCSYHAERKVAFHATLMCHRLTLRRRLNEMEIWVQTPVGQAVSPQPSEKAYAYKRIAMHQTVSMEARLRVSMGLGVHPQVDPPNLLTTPNFTSCAQYT